MATTAPTDGKSEITILARVLGDERGRLPEDLARYILDLGFSARQIERRLQRGSLQHLARGVYALRSSTPTWERTVVASWVATLEHRQRGALAMRTAGALHGFAGHPRHGAPEHVSDFASESERYGHG